MRPLRCGCCCPGPRSIQDDIPRLVAPDIVLASSERIYAKHGGWQKSRRSQHSRCHVIQPGQSLIANRGYVIERSRAAFGTSPAVDAPANRPVIHDLRCHCSTPPACLFGALEAGEQPAGDQCPATRRVIRRSRAVLDAASSAK